MSNDHPKKLRKLSPRVKKSNGIRILYVEDAAVIRDTIAKLLELNGYRVEYAKNGKEGVEKAVSWNPDVILMDLRMPVMDGYKAIGEIKQNPTTRHLPVFVVTAWSSKKERGRAHAAGADEFFVKPPDLHRLIETINRYAQPSIP
jgi:CheY-like chemotaxis protein